MQPCIKYSFETFDVRHFETYVQDWHEFYTPTFGDDTPADYVGVLRMLWDYIREFIHVI